MTNTPIRFTAEQERTLIAAMRRGDREAADLLARSVLPWACKTALRSAATMQSIDPEEAVSVAHYAVNRCLQRVDPAKGRLITIVTYSVRRLVRYYSRRFAGPIAAPECVFNPPAGRSVTAERHEQACRAQYRAANQDAMGRPLFESLVDASCPDPADRLEAVEAQQQISARMRRALATLTAREQEVVRRRVIDGDLLREVGRDLNLSRERVRQIERKALGKLKQVLEVIDDAGS